MTLQCLTDIVRNMEVAWGGEEYGRGTRMDYAEGDIQVGRG